MTPSPSCWDAGTLRRRLRSGREDPEQDELIEHLESCGHCQALLESLAADVLWWEDLRHIDRSDSQARPANPAPGWSSCGSGVGCDADAASLPPDFLGPAADSNYFGTIGPYLIEGELGRGSMGVVFKGHEPALNRTVAIKVLHPRLATSPSAHRRFAREARAAAAIVDDHIVVIHAVAEWRGLPYLVMPFIDGSSLQDRIESGSLGVRDVMWIGSEAARGLAMAHAQGLVHRDIKPENILLGGNECRVIITDFGLARAVDGAGLTQTGEVVGTPHYMAPEQARGEPVGPRADLFSLGSVLYTMCCGAPPFTADSALAVMRRVIDDRARPVSERNPNVPARLSALIEWLHAKDPDDRPGSAEEVAEELRRILVEFDDPGVETSHLTPPVAPDPPRRHRRARMKAVFTTGGAFIALLGMTLLSGPARLGRRSGGRPADPLAVTPSSATPRPERAAEFLARDRDTGLPVAGVVIGIAGANISAQTGQDGRCTLRAPADRAPSLGPGKRGGVWLVEPRGLPYLSFHQEPRPAPGGGPLRHEMGLKRGIEFRARILNGDSRRPLRGERLIYWPLAPNPAAQDALPDDASYPHCRAVEWPDGTYRGVAAPGPGVICVENIAGSYIPLAPGSPTDPPPGSSTDEAHELSRRYAAKALLRLEKGKDQGVHLQPVTGLAAVVNINPGAMSDPIEVTIELTRKPGSDSVR